MGDGVTMANDLNPPRRGIVGIQPVNADALQSALVAALTTQAHLGQAIANLADAVARNSRDIERTASELRLAQQSINDMVRHLQTLRDAIK